MILFGGNVCCEQLFLHFMNEGFTFFITHVFPALCVRWIPESMCMVIMFPGTSSPSAPCKNAQHKKQQEETEKEPEWKWYKKDGSPYGYAK